MPTFYYKAKNISGNTSQGEVQAISKDEVASILQQRGLFVTFLSNEPFSAKAKKQQVVEKKKAPPFLAMLFGNVSAEDKMAFSVQLANMITAGLTLMQAMQIFVQQTPNAKFRLILETVYHDIEGGMAFSDALAKHPTVFAPYFVSSVKAGEISGQLGTVLENVATFTEHDMETRQNIQAAMTYPIILLVVGTGIIILIITTVIPKFVATFLRIGVALPGPTQFMYNVSLLFTKQLDLLAIGIAAIVGSFYAVFGTPVGKVWLDQIALKVPILGSVVERFALARFNRTLSMLLTCGVPILQSLKIVEENVGNLIFARATDQAHEMIRQGVKIADALKATKVFPLDMVQMTAVGEETGRLDQLLKRLSEYYDQAAKISVKKFMSALEPMFLVVLGSIVAVVMASVLLPIFDMMKSARQG